MLSQSLAGPLSAFRRDFFRASKMKRQILRLMSSLMAIAAVLSVAMPAQAQTLALTPAVTDLYSKGFVNFGTTQVGASTTVTVSLQVTGGALTITSISVPTSTARVQQFKVGTITGCTVGASNPTGTTCSVPVTFTPNYTGYQTSPLIAVTSNGTFRFGLNGTATGPQAVLMPGVLSTIAGNGKVDGTAGTNVLQYMGDGGQATSAEVYSHGFAFDSLGDLYEAEYNASVIREINTSGVINTVAGTFTTNAGTGVETSTQCATPTVAPYPNCGNNVQALNAATFGNSLSDVAFDSAGNLYIADTIEDLIRRVDAVSGVITTIAGTGAIADSGDGGLATAAGVDTPEAVAVDSQDNIYTLDSNASTPTLGAKVRFISHSTGDISTIAGNGTACTATGTGTCGDGGAATSAPLGVSAAFYVDPATGHFWIADRDANRIRFVNFSFATPGTAGTISTVAGTGVAGFTGDGAAATAAELNGPHGIWVDPAGDIYVSDRNNDRVRFISASTGIITTLAGGGGTCTPGGNGTCGDGGPANGPNANLTPDDLVLDVNGNLYIADQANNAIRKITMNPTTLTFPTVPVGTTSGPLTATLQNIGNAPLIFTLPATPGVSNALVTTTGPTATASTAYAQTAATTCGPVYSTTTTNTPLAAGATCNYVVSFTPDTTTGNYTGTLVETDNSAVSQTQTINLVGAATAGTVTIGVTSSANPSTYGQSVTFTATLTGGGVPPTGTVTFTYTPSGSNTPVTIGTGTISTTGTTTTATISTTTLPEGVDTIVATYGGDGNYASGTASTGLLQTVNQAPVSNDTITAAPNPSTSGQTVTLTFTVPDGATAPANTTSVTFTTVINGTTTTLGTAAVTGVTAGGKTTYTTTTTALPVGTDTITGTFTGDTNYASGALTTQETVNQNGSTGDAVTVATNPTIVASADNITFGIPVVTGAAVPAGTVVFTSGTTSLGSATFTGTPTTGTCPSGTGTCYLLTVSTTALPLAISPATNTPVTATFTATTASGYASGAPTTTVVVNPVPGTNDAVTAANSTTTVGTADPLTFSIPVVTGAPVPTGTVAFTSGTTSLGSSTWPAAPSTGTCPGGTGTCYLLADSPSPTNIPLTVAPATNTPITATYTAGTGSGYASAAPTTQVVVNAAGGSGDTLTVANNPTTYGTADTLTFSIPVSSGAPAPAGTVVFTATGGVALGSATWPATPVVTGGYYTISISPTNIPVGAPTTVTSTFTATGASGYGSAAPTANVTVNKVPVSDYGIAANPSSISSGQTVTLTFTVTDVNNTPPTGTVTFTYNGTTLGTANLVGSTTGGVTTYTTTTTTLPVGSDTVTGTFSGDGNYSSGSLTTSVAVQSNTTTDQVTVATNPTTVGAADTITFGIPVTGGAAVPTGTVVFTSGTTSLGSATFGATPVTGTCPAGTGSCYLLTVSTTALPLTVSPSTSTPVLATYTAGGTSGYSSGTASTSVVVNQQSGTGDAVTAANSTTTVGTADPLTFSIPVASGVPAPTGTVTFTSGTTALGSATWPATPVTGTCPVGSGTCYLLADNPSPTNIPLTVAPATSTTVTATYVAGSGSGYASATPTTQVVVNAANGSGDTLTVANNPTTYGTADTLTFSIPVVSGAPVPAGTVTFTATGGVALGSATWPASPTVTGGFYTISISPSNLPVGSPTTVTGTFLATSGSGYASAAPTATVTVNKVPTSDYGISANPSATTSGQTVTLTFTVTDVNNTPPTGTVTFTYNGTTLGTANIVGSTTGGVTTYTTTTTTLPVGNDTVTGTFSGDGNYSAGSLTTPVAISSNTTTDTVSVATNPTTVGASDTITFSIPVTGGAAVPTGTVVFTSGTTNLGSATWPATPTATGGFYTLQITTTALPLTVAPATTTPVLATYTAGGTSGYTSATATTTVVVNQVSGSGDAVTAANSTTTVGTADPLTFSIPVVSGVPAPTGTVTFTSGTTALGSATWPATPVTGTCPVGSGTCYLLADNPSPTNIPLTVAPATSTTVTATYVAGSGSGYASAAPTTQVDVTPVGGTGGTLTIANNPTTYGTADPMTFSLPVSTGVPVPSGTVVFTAGGVTLGTATWPASPTVSNGYYTLTISPTNTPVGSPTTVTATFTPSTGSGYGASAPTATVTVNPVPLTNDSITASPNPQNFGSVVTLTFTVPNVNSTAPANTSTVTFTTVINGVTTTLGAGAVTGTTTGGVTTYTTTTSILPVGSNTITGTFSGDTDYAGGQLLTIETINAASTGATLGASPNPTTFGTPVTLTETIAPISGSCPTGPVTFLNGGVSIGTGAVSLTGGSCVATLTTSTLPVGTDNITATVPASGGFAAISSGPVAVTINKAPGTGDTLTTNPNPSTFGQTVTVTETLPTVGGVAPTGTVTFFNNGTSIGTGTVTGGVATLNTSVLPVGTDPITATYSGDGNYATVTSGPVSQVVNASTTGATLTANPNPTTFGTPVTLTETIAPVNGVCPVGPTTFLSNGTVLGTGVISLTGGSCVATLTTSSLPVGTDNITATVPADTNFSAITSGPVAVTVNKAPGTGDTLTTNPNPSTFGQTVTLTETLPTSGTVAPTGTVTFTYNGTTIGTGTVTGGVATVTTSTLPVGTDPITAVYSGDGNYATVTSGPVNQVVNSANGNSTLTANPNPTTFGTPVTLTETITPINNTCPTGPATFLSNGTALGTGVISLSGGSCVATLTTSTLPVGTDTITATVPGSNGFGPITSGPVNEQVGKASGSGDALTTNPNPSTFGQPVVITETLPTVGGVAPTGTVTFFNNGTSIGSAPVVSGVATITTSTLPEGLDPITGTYSGDGNYATVTTGPVNQVVNSAVGGATLAAGPNPATFGTTVTLTETITPINGTCPAGPTTFYNNGTSIGTGAESLTNGACVATLTTSTLPVGTDSITATVPASGGFTATTSGPVALVINPSNLPDTLTSNPNPSVFGNPVVITDTIPIAVTGVPPTGTVNFYSFNTLIGTGTVNAQGVATITTSTLPVGTDSLTGVYSGDANYAQVTTAPVNQVVTAVSATASLAVGPNPTNFGTTVTVTETIPVTNGTPATGSVTFFSNGSQIGTGTLVNGVATITTSTLPVGTDQITAQYNGDTNYSAVTSGPVAEIVNTANGADTLTVAPDPAVFGNPVVITDTIPTVGGVAPTGTVTFYDNGTAIGTGTVNAQGVATLTTTTLPVGSDPITASYGGDSNYAPETTGPVNEVVTVGNTTPVLGATPNPTTFGTTVTLTESIPGINGVTPTGTVTFTDNGTTIGTATLVNGVATITTSTLPIGTDPISATYSGDSNYGQANSGPLNVVVGPANPTDTLTANPNPSTFGDPVTLTFTVPPVNGVIPTGTVSFYNGTTLLGTGTVNSQGIATITTTALPFGTDTVTATYPGDNNYAPANPSTTISVGPVTPTSVLTGPTGTPTCGSSVTLTDTLTAVNGVALGGTVQFFDNGVAIGSPIPVPASGVVTFTTTSLPCTTDSITAVYTPPAGSPYQTSTGGPISVNVLNPDFSITATPANQTINPGDTTTYTVSLSGVGQPFTSPVTLSATGLPPGATVAFANQTYVPGAGPTSTTMTIVTAPNQAMLKHSSGDANGVYYGLLLLPLLGLRRVRRKIRALPKGITYCLAALLLLGGLGAMTGCGGGYFGPAPQTFTITVTGTSGTLSHSTTVTLTVR